MKMYQNQVEKKSSERRYSFLVFIEFVGHCRSFVPHCISKSLLSFAHVAYFVVASSFFFIRMCHSFLRNLIGVVISFFSSFTRLPFGHIIILVFIPVHSVCVHLKYHMILCENARLTVRIFGMQVTTNWLRPRQTIPIRNAGRKWTTTTMNRKQHV